MKTLAIDDKNNLIFESDFQLKDGADALSQDIKNLLMMFKGEYPFNTSKGISYYDLASQNNKQRIENAILERLKQDKRVKSITNLQIDFAKGEMQMSCEINSSVGVINV